MKGTTALRATLGGARWAGGPSLLMRCERTAPEDGEMLPSTGRSCIALRRLDAEVHGAVA
jgi:hypothetical protein